MLRTRTYTELSYLTRNCYQLSIVCILGKTYFSNQDPNRQGLDCLFAAYCCTLDGLWKHAIVRKIVALESSRKTHSALHERLWIIRNFWAGHDRPCRNGIPLHKALVCLELPSSTIMKKRILLALHTHRSKHSSMQPTSEGHMHIPSAASARRLSEGSVVFSLPLWSLIAR